MLTGLNDFGAANKYAVNELTAGDEQVFIEPQVSAGSGQIGVLGIEDDDVRALSRSDCSDGAPERLSTAGESVRIEAAADRFTFAQCQHVAGALAQALIVFELTQLRCGVELDV